MDKYLLYRINSGQYSLVYLLIEHFITQKRTEESTSTILWNKLFDWLTVPALTEHIEIQILKVNT